MKYNRITIELDLIIIKINVGELFYSYSGGPIFMIISLKCNAIIIYTYIYN